MSPEKEIRPLPFGVYFGTLVCLCLSGLGLSVYLAFSHYRLFTDMEYQSFCALTKSINCDTVSQSPYAVFGNLPVATWGAFGYGFFLMLLLFSMEASYRRNGHWALCLAAAIGFSSASLLLAGISTFLVGSYCILCIATYGINLLLVYFVWLIRRRFSGRPVFGGIRCDLAYMWRKRALSFPGFAAFSLALALTCTLYPAYWKMSMPPPGNVIKSGMTAEGHPWIGAENPAYEIVEFSDYMCFQCRKMHTVLRRFVAQNPDRLRLVHYNYPMDHEFNPIVKEPFHIGSGKMALLAVHALAAGKFWEMNDRLYEAKGSGPELDLARIAADVGLDAKELSYALQHQPYHQHLSRDIRQGMKYRILGTPSFLIEGKIYAGHIPAEILKKILAETPPDDSSPLRKTS